MNPHVSPDPSDEEAAAIVAALEFAWPKPVVLVGGSAAPERRTSAWRFSGRWWMKPIPNRRDRPNL